MTHNPPVLAGLSAILSELAVTQEQIEETAQATEPTEIIEKARAASQAFKVAKGTLDKAKREVAEKGIESLSQKFHQGGEEAQVKWTGASVTFTAKAKAKLETPEGPLEFTETVGKAILGDRFGEFFEVKHSIKGNVSEAWLIDTIGAEATAKLKQRVEFITEVAVVKDHNNKRVAKASQLTPEERARLDFLVTQRATVRGL